MKKKKITKKKIIIFSIIAVVIIISIFANVNKNKAIEVVEYELEEIGRRTIAKSISATGVINTTDTKNVVATLSGMEISNVNVKKGDKINPGDIICTFDTSTIQENLNIAEASKNTAQAQANLGIQSAQRNLNDAIANKDTQIASSQGDLSSAQKAYDDSQKQLNTINNSLVQKQNELNNYSKTYTQALTTFEKVKNEYDAKEKAYNELTNSYNAQLLIVENAKNTYNKYFQVINGITNQLDSLGAIIDPINYQNGSYATTTHENVDVTYKTSQTSLSTIETNLNTAKSNYLNYKSTYDAANNTFLPIQSQYQNLSTQVTELQSKKVTLEATTNNLKTAYDKTVNAYNSAVSTADSTIATLRDNVTNSELSAISSSLAQAGQINSLKEQIENGIIKSTVSGTVTSVSVKKGDLYTGATIATIEGCEEFIIEAEIDEYDIPDVEVGMKVLIKTDATRDEELEGRITYVAASATNSNQTMGTMATTGSSNNATYKIEISLDSQNERLRLGMNAKLSIITEMEENVLSVPYDAIHKRDDGTSYIEIAKDDKGEEKEEIDVEIGIEGTYYTEVKSEKLKEGIKVILPKVESGNSIENLIEMMGPNAGI